MLERKVVSGEDISYATVEHGLSRHGGGHAGLNGGMFNVKNIEHEKAVAANPSQEADRLQDLPC